MLHILTSEVVERRAKELLNTPTLKEVFDHPEKWEVLGIRNGQIEVALKPKPRLEPVHPREP